MKKLIQIVFLIFVVNNGFSQLNHEWSIEAGLIQNHQHFLQLYDGLIDIGAAYDIALFGNLSGGVSMNIGWLRRSNTSSAATAFRPKINLKYSIRLSPKLDVVPQASIGYAIVNLRNPEYDYKEMQAGINSGAGLRVVWDYSPKTAFFLFGKLDYIYLNKDENFTRLEYFREVYITTFGVGLIINRNNETGL